MDTWKRREGFVLGGLIGVIAIALPLLAGKSSSRSLVLGSLCAVGLGMVGIPFALLAVLAGIVVLVVLPIMVVVNGDLARTWLLLAALFAVALIVAGIRERVWRPEEPTDETDGIAVKIDPQSLLRYGLGVALALLVVVAVCL